ncbi:hypothetical protein LCGC14_0415900 [marine sediment metagenome]|uniref:DNA-directed DNA polymerase family A palm domain-containing protein n=1 Tax=marine sediment metagenome TaxID=412755 RepID=A0A0F9SYF7_9ZZZZ
MNWQNVLHRIGYPGTALVLDFETFFDVGYTLKTMPVIEFLSDERFEFTGLGDFTMKHPFDDPINAGFSPPDKIQYKLDYFQEEYGEEFEDCTLVGANLPFDAMILAMKFGIYPRYTIDILDLARYFDPKQLVSVAEQAKRAGMEPKGDTNAFKGLHWEDMTYEQKIAMFKYCRHDIYLEAELFKTELPRLTNPKVELYLAHHTLELFSKPRLAFDFPLARELHYGMTKEKNIVLAKTSYTQKELSGTISFAQILTDNLPEGEVPLKFGKPTKNLIPITGEHKIIACAADDEGRKFLMEHPDENIRNIIEAKIGITSWPKWAKRVKRMAMMAKAFDGKFPVPLRYCGAHTKRWTGTGKVNPLNLGGAGRAGSGTHPLLSQVRHLLLAPEGFVLGIVDAAQIECRLLAWFAGETQLLEGFAESDKDTEYGTPDVYSKLAMDLFGGIIYKADKDRETPEDYKQLVIRRGFGKDGILGCGYSLGADTFFDRCYSNPVLRPMFDDGTFTRAFIERLIKTYRTKYTQIVKLWGDLERAYKFVTRYKNEPVELNRGLKFFAEGHTTVIELPSGSRLYYPHASVSGTGKWSDAGYEHGKVYGGMLAENIMQSVSREHLIGVIMECESLLHHVVLHTYDEVCCLIDEGNEKRAMKSIIAAMCRVPKWADGDLPLGYDSFTSKCFRK